MTRQLIDQSHVPMPVHCCVCVNKTMKLVPATNSHDGYMLCDEHSDMLLQEFAHVIWTYVEEAADGS